MVLWGGIYSDIYMYSAEWVDTISLKKHPAPHMPAVF